MNFIIKYYKKSIHPPPIEEGDFLMILLNGGLKMKKTLGKIHIALTILVLFLSMLGGVIYTL